MTDWWRGAVIYQIYPRSFCDSNGDGVGDLAGIIDKLDYLERLGVDAIWVSPFYRSPMKDFGYDVTDHRDVDPLFGTLEDFDQLLDGAHARDIKVLIDQVYSHTSDQCPWFNESRSSRTGPKADWYVWADAKADGSPPSNWLSEFGGSAWCWDSRRKQYYLHNFLAEQPDLNLHNAEVQQALLDHATFWLERGVDGFRLDAVSMYTHDRQLRDNPPAREPRVAVPYFMQEHQYDVGQPETLEFLHRLRALLDQQTGVVSIAEVFEDDPVLSIEYCRPPDRLHTAYNFGFLSSRHAPTPVEIRKRIEQWNIKESGAWPSWAFSNHDVPRVLSRWGGPNADEAQANLYLALLLTLPGTVFLYQGEELGLTQAEIPYDCLADPEALRNWPETLGRDGARTPMPWSANGAACGFSEAEPWLLIPEDHRNRAIDLQESNASSTLNTTRALIRLRRENLALRSGAIRFLNAPDSVLAFVRGEGDDQIGFVFNLSPEAQTVRLPDFVAGQTIEEIELGGAVDNCEVILQPWGLYAVRLG